PVADREIGAQRDHQLRHVIGLTEWTRQLLVEDLPVALLRVAQPYGHATVAGLPQPRLERHLELELVRLQRGRQRRRLAFARRKRAVVDVAAVAEQYVVRIVESQVEARVARVGVERPGFPQQRA